MRAAFAYHLNVMPLDSYMPDPGALARGIDVAAEPGTEDTAPDPVVVVEDAGVRVTAVAVTHGRAVPALAYRFDTADGSVVFSGDTSVNENLIALAQGADILVHQVADLSYLRRHGMDDAEVARMAALHTDVSQVGSVAERAGARELILNHTSRLIRKLSPTQHGPTAPGRDSAVPPPRATTACAGRSPPGHDGTFADDHVRRVAPRPRPGGPRHSHEAPCHHARYARMSGCTW